MRPTATPTAAAIITTTRTTQYYCYHHHHHRHAFTPATPLCRVSWLTKNFDPRTSNFQKRLEVNDCSSDMILVQQKCWGLGLGVLRCVVWASRRCEKQRLSRRQLQDTSSAAKDTKVSQQRRG